MKYRKKSKIKQKHHILNKLKKHLKYIEKWEEAKAIIPGIIKTCNHNNKLTIIVRYQMTNGIKCYAKNNGAIQEFFIVSDNTSELINKLLSYLKSNKLIV